MIREVRVGADPTIVVRSKVDDEKLIPISSPNVDVKFIPESDEEAKSLEAKSRTNRKKNKSVDPLEELDKE